MTSQEPTPISATGAVRSAGRAGTSATATEPPTTGPGISWKGDTARVAPSREHLLGALFMVVLCLMFAGFKFEWFFWVPLVPLLFVLWVFTVNTEVGPTGIRTRYLLRKNRQMSWEEFESIQFNKSGKAFAVGNGSRMWLPGVTFNSLITLSIASHGRIPDPVTPGRNAADAKVQVVHKDGYAVLMDPDEYAEYEAQRRAEHGEEK